MNAQELRIGNIIGMNLKEFPENYFTVLEVAESAMKVSDRHESHYFDAEDMEGIPLSSDWLNKYGFFRYNNAFVLRDPTKRNMYANYGPDDFEVFDHGDKLTFNGSEFAPQIHFVHQLQNLYFALTGTELQIKS